MNSFCWKATEQLDSPRKASSVSQFRITQSSWLSQCMSSPIPLCNSQSLRVRYLSIDSSRSCTHLKAPTRPIPLLFLSVSPLLPATAPRDDRIEKWRVEQGEKKAPGFDICKELSTSGNAIPEGRSRLPILLRRQRRSRQGAPHPMGESFVEKGRRFRPLLIRRTPHPFGGNGREAA